MLAQVLTECRGANEGLDVLLVAEHQLQHLHITWRHITWQHNCRLLSQAQKPVQMRLQHTLCMEQLAAWSQTETKTRHTPDTGQTRHQGSAAQRHLLRCQRPAPCVLLLSSSCWRACLLLCCHEAGQKASCLEML